MTIDEILQKYADQYRANAQNAGGSVPTQPQSEGATIMPLSPGAGGSPTDPSYSQPQGQAQQPPAMQSLSSVAPVQDQPRSGGGGGGLMSGMVQSSGGGEGLGGMVQSAVTSLISKW